MATSANQVVEVRTGSVRGAIHNKNSKNGATYLIAAALLAASVFAPSTSVAESVCDGESLKTLKEILLPNSEFPENGAMSFQFDLNGDGKKEVFQSVGCGNGFCNLIIYRKIKRRPGKYSCVGALDASPESFEVLKARHHGWPDILTVSSAGAGRYRLSRLEFDQEEYKEVAGIEADESILEFVKPSYRGDDK